VTVATPLTDLHPVRTDPAHPWNDTLAVEPELVPFPGPEVRVRQGGRVRITIENRLHTPTSIHWHGIHMRGQGWMDGAVGWTECGIPPYGRFTYDFVVEQEPGTHWWR
jgi:FtsP/CotA-like multicopper oxidase with cupredoxin domain